MAKNSLNGPLKGIRVLDWTIWQMGPVAASMMGDMGADVVKIEALDGDAGRALARATSISPNLAPGRNAYFEAGNRNKRGIALNLKTLRDGISSTGWWRPPTYSSKTFVRVWPSGWAWVTKPCGS